jgi:two-component system, NarL family, nitrate/nitrite response regulator NarL
MADRVEVFVAEDHPLFRSAVTDAIKARPELKLVGTADNGRSALDQIQRLEPDVALLDMRMPDLDGAQVLNAITRDGMGTRVVFLSSYADSSMIYDVLANGAAGYLDKCVSAEQVCEAILAVTRGETALSDEIKGGVLQQIRLRGDERDTKLTPREREVLKLVAEGLSAPEVGVRLFIEQSTVKSHLKNIYEKLGVSERAAAVAEGMRRGLLE